MVEPRFKELLSTSLEGASAAKLDAYNVAYLDGAEVSLLISGVIGIAGAPLAWFLTGRRDPLKAVFDMQDERVGSTQDEPEVMTGKHT
jgi:hypothetical protein